MAGIYTAAEWLGIDDRLVLRMDGGRCYNPVRERLKAGIASAFRILRKARKPGAVNRNHQPRLLNLRWRPQGESNPCFRRERTIIPYTDAHTCATNANKANVFVYYCA